MKVTSFFEKNPVFRYAAFSEYMTQQGTTRPESWKYLLHYHHKAGHIIRIKKGLYAVKPIFINADQFWIDSFIIAAKAAPDAIIAYHSALELHGLAYTTFEEHYFLTKKNGQIFQFEGQVYHPVKIPKILIDLNKTDVNVISMNRQGVSIKTTGIERTVVDILDRPDLSGGWEEVWRSLDHLIQFDPEKLINYTLLRNNATIVAKVGFFLEQRPQHLAIDERYIKKLLPYIPKKAHYMIRDRQYKGKLFKRWNLIVPFEIIEQQWEEPHADDF